MGQPILFESNNKNLVDFIFNLTADCNLAELDGHSCAMCHEVPLVKMHEKFLKSGKMIMEKDRSSRIDCDAGNGTTQLVTYHIACWQRAVLTGSV